MGFFGSNRPDNLGLKGGRLVPCPDKPNCVASLAQDDARVEPLSYTVDAEAAWEALLETLRGWENVTVVTAVAGYVHAECRTPLLGFIDDLELHQPEDEAGVIHVRSASRVGYSDLGANRKRVEELRERFDAALEQATR